MKYPSLCVVFSFILFVQNAAAKKKLEEIVPLCDPKDPKLNECVKESINKFIPQLRNGIPDLGLPPYDPFEVPLMDMGQEGGSVYVQMQFNDTVHTGFSGIVAEDVSIDMENNVWNLTVLQPFYNMIGKYKISGKILVLPVNGAGTFNLTCHDIHMHIQMALSKKTVDGKEFLNLDSIKYTITPTPKANYLDMVGQDEFDKLEGTFRTFMRDNTDEIFVSMKETIEGVYASIVKAYLTNMFNEVPYNELFKNV